MKGKLKYFKKCEETINTIEGWSIMPLTNKLNNISYNLTENSLIKISNFDKTQEYFVDYQLLTNCRIDENGYHSHHSVIAEII